MSLESLENSDTSSRREFLCAAAGIVAGGVGMGTAGLSRLATAAKDKQPALVDFGFSLYGTRSLKTADALKTCADIGYDSVELVSTKGWPCDPTSLSKMKRRDIRKQLRDNGLQLPSLMENVHVVGTAATMRANIDRLKRAGELGHALSPKAPPVIETVLGGRSAQWDALKAKFVAGLKEWAKVAEQERTVIAIKAHVGGALYTPHDAKWLVDEVGSPWIRLTYDFSHFQLNGFDLTKSLQTMVGDTVFIHVKDKTGDAKKFRFLLPGEGDIDYEKYFTLLKKNRYRGSVMVEVSSQIHKKPGYDAVKAAKTGYKNLAGYFKRVRLARIK